MDLMKMGTPRDEVRDKADGLIGDSLERDATGYAFRHGECQQIVRD
jgi:hypothetical protein